MFLPLTISHCDPVRLAGGGQVGKKAKIQDPKGGSIRMEELPIGYSKPGWGKRGDRHKATMLPFKKLDSCKKRKRELTFLIFFKFLDFG